MCTLLDRLAQPHGKIVLPSKCAAAFEDIVLHHHTEFHCFYAGLCAIQEQHGHIKLSEVFALCSFLDFSPGAQTNALVTVYATSAMWTFVDEAKLIVKVDTALWEQDDSETKIPDLASVPNWTKRVTAFDEQFDDKPAIARSCLQRFLLSAPDADPASP